ncbi:hypothetical protein JNUCC64_01860 [Streptomyces sp. JNUCC 64]
MLIGVLSGTAEEPRVVPTERALPVDRELIELAGPVAPDEVFRFAAPCRTSECAHFKDSACGIAGRGVVLLDEVTVRLPACPIRARCRWFRQEGPPMCRRCPQIVTHQRVPSDEMLRIVTETDAPAPPAPPAPPGPSACSRGPAPGT